MYMNAQYMPSGDCGIVVEFGNEITEAINQKVRGMMIIVEAAEIDGITETVPTYRSLLIQYDPRLCLYEDLKRKLMALEAQMDSIAIPEPVVYKIPTAYGGEYGPDIQHVAENAGISVEEVITAHASREYLIYMLGFTPGFPYLGGMDQRISTPRLSTPRTRIPGGSVGIAGNQTGIYPMDSPGGWQLIGKTPVRLYDATATPPILLSAGNYIRFVPVCQETYRQIEEQIKAGSYSVEICSREWGTA